MTEGSSDDRSLPIGLVTQRFPPMDSTGTIRIDALREHFETFDIKATYITLPDTWIRQYRQRSAEDYPGHEDTRILRPSSPSDRVMRLISNIPLLRRMQRWVFVPDIHILWARHIGRSIATDLSDVSAMYVTGPPFSAYEAARRIAERNRIPLILEMRDPPVLGKMRTPGIESGRYSPSFIRRVANFERRQVLAADLIVVLSPGVKRHLLATYPDLSTERVVVVPNGSGTPNPSRSTPTLSSGRFSIVYAGSLRGGDTVRELHQVAKALDELEEPAELRMVGRFSRAVQTLISQDVRPETITWHGRVSRERAIEQLELSDVSLVLASESEDWWIGRKVIESLLHASQILAIAPPGDVTDLLQQSTKSIVIEKSEITEQLPLAINTLMKRARNPRSTLGPEPAVPTDAQMTEAIAEVARSAVSGRTPRDWSWTQPHIR